MFNYSYCSSVAGAEKLQERAKRFGLPDPTEDAEKKKKRAERFGQPEDKEFEAKKKVRSLCGGARLMRRPVWAA